MAATESTPVIDMVVVQAAADIGAAVVVPVVVVGQELVAVAADLSVLTLLE
jgi:hypothetical protein